MALRVSLLTLGTKVEWNYFPITTTPCSHVYGVTKLVLKPDSWRLFRYIRTDYVRAYRNTLVPVLILDRAADAITVDGMQK